MTSRNSLAYPSKSKRACPGRSTFMPVAKEFSPRHRLELCRATPTFSQPSSSGNPLNYFLDFFFAGFDFVAAFFPAGFVAFADAGFAEGRAPFGAPSAVPGVSGALGAMAASFFSFSRFFSRATSACLSPQVM